jgi:4'-phosphopantetheinyl transferase
MPILFEEKMDNVIILIYKIEFGVEFYKKGIDFTDFDINEYTKITNEVKQLQWLASRYWLKKISKQQKTLHLEKTELGKPHITNFKSHFSISHSRDKIAIIFSLDTEVGIDIEHCQDKIFRVRPKFINHDDFESENSVENTTLIWSAKESIYKFFHDKSLYSFKETIAITQRNEITVDFKLYSSIASNAVMHYKVIDDLVITWIY